MQYLQGLTRLNDAPVDMTLEALDAMNRQKQEEQFQLKDLQQRQEFDQAANPMRLQQMQLANDRGLQGLYAEKRSNKENDFLSTQRMQTELSDLLTKASKNDVARMVDQFQTMAFSDDPSIRSKGLAGLSTTKDFLLLNNKTEGSLDKTRMQTASNEEVARIRNQRPVGGQGRAPKTEQELTATMSPERAMVFYKGLADQAAAAGNDQEAQRRLMQANDMKQAAERLRTISGQTSKEGKVDMGAMSGLPTMRAPQPEGFARPATSSGAVPVQPAVKFTPAQQSWIDRAKSLNPGMSEAQIIQQGVNSGKLK